MKSTEYPALFADVKTIAVHGMSRAANKPSHTVPLYMHEQGYKLFPINPYADEILGLKVYRNLLDIPERIDLLNVFRPSHQVKAVVEEALERRRLRGDIDTIWLQLGIMNDEARDMAEAAGIAFVQNRCIYVEHLHAVPG